MKKYVGLPMKRYLGYQLFICISFSSFFMDCVRAQVVDVIREIPLHERKLGRVAFFQHDFNGDGAMDFLTDGDDKGHVAICTLIESDIVVLAQFTIPNADDFKDLLLEDADGDGEKEIYIFLEGTGMIRLSREDLQPIDTLGIFTQFTDYIHTILLDIDLDQQPEWILLDNTKGLNIIDPVSLTIESSMPELDGRSFLGGNVDTDPQPELVINRNGNLHILDGMTQLFQDTIVYSFLSDYQLIDIDQSGRNLIVTREIRTIRIYNAVPKEFTDSFTFPSTYIFDGFFPAQLEPDTRLELVLYTENDTRITWLNTFPMAVLNENLLKKQLDVGTFLAASQFSANPFDMLFSYTDATSARAGLVRYNLLNYEANLTHVRDRPNALLYTNFGPSLEKFFLTIPNNEFKSTIAILNQSDFSTHAEIDASPLLPDYNPILSQEAKEIRFNGQPTPYFLFQQYGQLSLFNSITGMHHHMDISNANVKYADDIDYDGTTEITTTVDDGLQVFSLTNGFDLSERFTPLPGSSGVNLILCQLDQSKAKEMLSFNNRNFVIYSSEDGHLIRERNNIVSQLISAIMPYTDGKGNFYLAIVGGNRVYIYGMTEDMVIHQFSAGSGFATVAGEVIQLELDGQLQTYFAIYKEAFRVFDLEGDMIYTHPDLPSTYDFKGKIIIDDFNRNGKPNMLVSSVNSYLDLELDAPGVFYKPFYLTTIQPQDSSTVDHEFNIFLQFSELVDLQTAKEHIHLLSANMGELDYTIVAAGPMMLQLIPQLLPNIADQITIQIDGHLISKLDHRLDANYDGVTLGNEEPVFRHHYFITPGPHAPSISITAIRSISPVLYAETNLHFPFDVVSTGAFDNALPIAGMHYRVIGGQEGIALPADSVYDESTERVLLPLNTFGMEDGTYSVEFYALDYSGHSSDTFSIDFEVIHETAYLDKHPGANLQRTSTYDNTIIGNSFTLVHTHFLDENEPTHVVGGQGTYSFQQTDFSVNEGIIKNISLFDFSDNWEVTLPLFYENQSPYLDRGILYITSNSEPDQPKILHAIDVRTGEEYWRQPFHSFTNFEETYTSPIANDNFLIFLDLSHGGLYCMDRWTGQIQWFGPGIKNGGLIGKPAIFDGKVFCIVSGNMQALDLETGSVLWSTELDPYQSPLNPYVTTVIDTSRGLIFWRGEFRINAYDIHTGDFRWTRIVPGGTHDLVVHGDELIHVGFQLVQFLSTENGTPTRSIETNWIYSYASAQPVVANQKLFLPLFSGFHVFELDSLQEIWYLDTVIYDISIIDSYLFLTTEENTIYVYNTSTVGTAEAEINNLMVYPNPFTDVFSIEREEFIDRIDIVDALGRKVYSGKPDRIPYKRLTPGLYFLHIRMQDGSRYCGQAVRAER